MIGYDEIICYDEPDINGNNIHHELSVLDAIRLQKLYGAEMNHSEYYIEDEREALDDFMAINFAYFKSDIK